MRRPPWRAALAFALLSAGAFLCLGEVAVRVLALGGGSFYQPDPILGSWHRPNARGSERGECYASRIAMNANGMRDVERSHERSAGVPRVAVLGDSFMEGMQVDLHQLFTQRLQLELASVLRVPRVEVLNFGVSGFGTVQEYWTYRERVRDFAPDLVLLAFFPGNDVTDDSPSLSGDSHRPHFRLTTDGGLEAIPFQPYSVHPAVRWLKDHFQLYGWLFKRAARIPALRHVLLHRADVPPPIATPPATAPSAAVHATASVASHNQAEAALEQAWSVTERVVERLRNEVQADGHRFLMVVIPERAALPAPSEHSRGASSVATPRLEQLCARVALECVFLEPAFVQACPSGGGCLDDLFLPCDGHFAPGGHALAARATAQAIASRGLVPETR